MFLRSAIRTADGGVVDEVFRDVEGDGGGFRPFALLLFIGLYRVVGDTPAVFHGVLLAAHLATVLIVFVLVRRMFRAVVVAGVAALLFATHPVGFESVTWVAAISTWGIPLAFSSWWLLIGAEDQAPHLARYVAAIAVFVVAVMFRESAGLIVFAMLAWLWAERGLRRVAVVTAPFFVVAAITLAAGKWFTWAVPMYGTISSTWRRHVWTQLQRAWVPSEHTGLLGDLQAVSAIASSPPRLSPCTWVSGGSPRSRPASSPPSWGCPWFGLATTPGTSTPRPPSWPSPSVAFSPFSLSRVSRRVRTAGWVAFAGAIVLSGWWVVRTRDNVDRWVASSPASYSDFVDQARRELETLPDGTHLFVANIPLELGLFDGFYVDVIADVLWPEADVATELVAVERVGQLRARLVADERLLVFRPDQYGCSVLADQEAAGPPIHVVEAGVETGDDPFEATVVEIGPMRDGLGDDHVGVRRPWAHPLAARSAVAAADRDVVGDR